MHLLKHPLLFKKLTAKPIAVWLLLIVVVAAFMSKKSFMLEDLVVHNPAYMVAEYNKVTFPIYEYYGQGSWDGMWIHPPLHYVVVGLLMKLFPMEVALNVYYLLLTALLFTAIAYLRYQAVIRICLLTGAFVFVISQFRNFQNFSFRPEMAVALCWVAGTFFLESARQRNWNSKLLSAGTLAVLYGALSQYFAYLSVSTIGVYFLLFLLSSKNHKNNHAAKLFIGIAALAGLLYVLLFLAPYHTQILNWISGAKPSAEVRQLSFPFGVLEYHLQLHRYDPSFFFRHHLSAGLVACALLFLFKRFRVLAFSLLPFVIALTFIPNGKKQYYGFPEWLLADLGIAACVGEIILLLSNTIRFSYRVRRVVLGISVVVFLFCTFRLAFLTGQKEFQYQPHPIDVLRSLSQVTTGENALIGGRHGLWYASGAAKWYSEEVSIWNKLPDSIEQYLSGPDYFAMYWLMPYELPDWRFEGAYVRKELDLKAVVIGHSASFGIYSGKHKDDAIAFDFSVMNDSVHRFIPTDTGSYTVGSFSVFNAHDSMMIANQAESFVFFDTKASFDSLPAKVAFACVRKANSAMKESKPLEIFSATKQSFSFSEWMKKHPLNARHVAFYKTQTDALRDTGLVPNNQP